MESRSIQQRSLMIALQLDDLFSIGRMLSLSPELKIGNANQTWDAAGVYEPKMHLQLYASGMCWTNDPAGTANRVTKKKNEKKENRSDSTRSTSSFDPNRTTYTWNRRRLTISKLPAGVRSLSKENVRCELRSTTPVASVRTCVSRGRWMDRQSPLLFLSRPLVTLSEVFSCKAILSRDGIHFLIAPR